MPAMLVLGGLVGRPAPAPAQTPEVRQIITFLWSPGRGADALRIYRDSLMPIYRGIPQYLRHRAYGEVESSEPLDLIEVTAFSSMAGMDSAGPALRRPGPAGRSAVDLYGALDGITQRHHDQFVVMLPALSDSAADQSGLVVFEYLRLAPGAQRAFESGLGALRRAEREAALYSWSETGRLLVSDGWDYLRVYGVPALAGWQRYRELARALPAAAAVDRLVAARKTIIVKAAGGLALR